MIASRRVLLHACLATCIAVAGAACAALGYSNRVLWRVASPDGRFFAVCQEIPVFDGPSYDVRLERADGTTLRRLYKIGDGDPCSEVVWSDDSNTLAIVSGHVARVRFVDVRWALERPDVETAYWSWRQVDLSTEGTRLEGARFEFTGPMTAQLSVCRAAPKDQKVPCEPKTKRFEIPQPIVTGHPVTASRGAS